MTNKLGTCCLNRCISQPMNSQLLVKAKGKDSQSPHSCASGCHYKRMKQAYFGVWGRQSARTQQCCECVCRDNSDLGVASSLLHALKCLPRHCTHCTASSVHGTTSSILISHSLSLFSLSCYPGVSFFLSFLFHYIILLIRCMCIYIPPPPSFNHSCSPPTPNFSLLLFIFLFLSCLYFCFIRLGLVIHSRLPRICYIPVSTFQIFMCWDTSMVSHNWFLLCSIHVSKHQSIHILFTYYAYIILITSVP